MDCTPDELTGKQLAVHRALGQDVPDSLIASSEDIGDRGKAAFADSTGKINTINLEDVANHQPDLPENRAAKNLEGLGLAKSWLTLNSDPRNVLGLDYVQPLLDAIQGHYETYGNKDWGAFQHDVLHSSPSTPTKAGPYRCFSVLVGIVTSKQPWATA